MTKKRKIKDADSVPGLRPEASNDAFDGQQEDLLAAAPDENWPIRPDEDLFAGRPDPTVGAASTGEALAIEPKPLVSDRGADEAKVRHILYAEDNKTNQFLAAALLRDSGWHLDFVENGLEALEALRRKPYDLILMDVQMPQMDGNEATRRIRAGEAGEANRFTPILAVTAHGLPEYQRNCLSSGMSGYLSKSMNRAVMFEIIKSHLPEIPGSPEASAAVAEDTPAGKEPPIFDRDSFIDRVFGDVKIARQVARRAIDDFARELSGVREAVQLANPEKLRFHAHGLKGVARLLECQQLAHLAQSIEMLPEDRMVGETAEQMDSLLSHGDAAMQALDDFCKNK